MKIAIVGAGPAGLHFAALMQRLDPGNDITIYERGSRDATWGFGVVFSDHALDFLQADDPELYGYLLPHMQSWDDLMVTHNDTRICIAGNGFASIGRLEMLTLLYAWVERLGVTIEFGTEVTSFAQLPPVDLIVAANGAGSWIRDGNQEKFETCCESRPNKFMWCGSSKAFSNLSLTFHETADGVLCAHHYRYSPSMSTFLVEVSGETWRRAGFETMDLDDTLHHCEQVFANELDGQPIISNGSHWRNFPVIWNDRWSFDNVVLLGDALRPAHFSIGSGTRMAMLDALALYMAFKQRGADVQAALVDFQTHRMPAMRKIWDAANRSMEWYERMDILVPGLTPVEFAYSYMTRTGRVDHARVRRIDPALAGAYEKLHPEVAGG